MTLALLCLIQWSLLDWLSGCLHFPCTNPEATSHHLSAKIETVTKRYFTLTAANRQTSPRVNPSGVSKNTEKRPYTCANQSFRRLFMQLTNLTLLSASRCRRLGLATRSPRNPVRRRTCTTDIRKRDPYVCPASVRMPPDKPCRWRRHFSPQTRINRFVFLNLPILSLEAHLGVTTSPHAPFPTGYVTLPMYGRSPPLRLVQSRSR
jgi:hypothetical protein